MKMKRFVALALAGAMVLSVTACSKSGSNDSSGDKIEITILGNIKSEVSTQFEDLRKAYNESQDKYELVSIPLDGNAYEKMTSLYASGNAPTIMTMGQEVAEFSDKLLDLSDQELLTYAQKGSYDAVTTSDGKVLGLPLTVEAFGMLYNKEVVDKAVGGTFDPSTIDSRTALKNLFDTIKNSGVAATDICPLDWSLGAHLTNLIFSPQNEDLQKDLDFLTELKGGKVNLVENDVFNGWVDTFDMLKEYNVSSGSPLATTYDDGALNLADGKSATWFQGNWTLTMLQEINPDINVGILPYPVSDDASDYGNTQISVGVSLYFAIDASQSSKEEQEGAKDFLNFFFTSEKGQDVLVNDMKLIPIYDCIKIEPTDYLSKSISDYLKAGKTLQWINIYYPADALTSMGASIQKYLDGAIDRQGLATEIENYWKTQK